MPASGETAGLHADNGALRGEGPLQFANTSHRAFHRTFRRTAGIGTSAQVQSPSRTSVGSGERASEADSYTEPCRGRGDYSRHLPEVGEITLRAITAIVCNTRICHLWSTSFLVKQCSLHM